MIVATRVRDLDGWTGDASVYRLSEPFEDTVFEGPDWEDRRVMIDHVVVSATSSGGQDETLIFSVRPGGQDSDVESELIASWSEVAGVRGVRSHARAIEKAGWVVEGKGIAMHRIHAVTGGRLESGYLRLADPQTDGYCLEVGIDEDGRLSVQVEICGTSAAQVRQAAADAVVALDRLEGLGIVHRGCAP
jgi:hypothetical protein